MSKPEIKVIKTSINKEYVKGMLKLASSLIEDDDNYDMKLVITKSKRKVEES